MSDISPPLIINLAHPIKPLLPVLFRELVLLIHVYPETFVCLRSLLGTTKRLRQRCLVLVPRVHVILRVFLILYIHKIYQIIVLYSGQMPVRILHPILIISSIFLMSGRVFALCVCHTQFGRLLHVRFLNLLAHYLSVDKLLNLP